MKEYQEALALDKNLSESIKALADLKLRSQMKQGGHEMQDMLDKLNQCKKSIDNTDRLNNLIVVNFVQEKLKTDIGYCMDCIYNRKDIEEYFEVMIRI